MKKIASLCAMLFAIMLFANCNKEDDKNSYNIAAYTQTDSMDVFLFVNEQNKGKLPYVASGIDACGDDQALNLNLDPGMYSLSVKDDQGGVKNALVLEIGEEDVTIDSLSTNYMMTQFGKCVMLGIDY